MIYIFVLKLTLILPSMLVSQHRFVGGQWGPFFFPLSPVEKLAVSTPISKAFLHTFRGHAEMGLNWLKSKYFALYCGIRCPLTLLNPCAGSRAKKTVHNNTFSSLPHSAPWTAPPSSRRDAGLFTEHSPYPKARIMSNPALFLSFLDGDAHRCPNSVATALILSNDSPH